MIVTTHLAVMAHRHQIHITIPMHTVRLMSRNVGNQMRMTVAADSVMKDTIDVETSFHIDIQSGLTFKEEIERFDVIHMSKPASCISGLSDASIWIPSICNSS